MADDTLNLEGAGRPIAGRRRFNNASPRDQRLFLKAFMDENLQTWKDSEGTVYRINRRGNIASSFAGSTEIVSEATRAQKLRAGRLAKRDKNLAIKANSTKRAAGLTKGQRLTASQEQLFATSDVAESDEQIQKRIRGDINKQKTKSFKPFLASQGIGLGFAPAIGAGLDEIFALRLAERSSGGGAGSSGRPMGKPGKVKL
jgi:hypothetical protein